MNNGNIQAGPEVREFSGKKFVIGAIATIAVTWGTLFLVFRDWKARHREASEFGRREVATVVDPLIDMAPPGVDRKQWRRAVDDSHDMLMTVTGSGQLDLAAMTELRDRLRLQFARTTPETAVADLGRLWDRMEADAGPVLTRKSERPPFAPERPALLPKQAGAR